MDPDVVAAASRIPGRHKLAHGSNKRVLRRLADKLLPPEVARAPKQAFYLPLESYVRTGPVADILRYTLDAERTRRRGLFRPEWVSAMLQSPPDAGFLPLKRLFSITMLELWFDRFCPDASWA
jgi:asparagine synthase (glutamine-hydrolysing)